MMSGACPLLKDRVASLGCEAGSLEALRLRSRSTSSRRRCSSNNSSTQGAHTAQLSSSLADVMTASEMGELRKIGTVLDDDEFVDVGRAQCTKASRELHSLLARHTWLEAATIVRSQRAAVRMEHIDVKKLAMVWTLRVLSRSGRRSKTNNVLLPPLSRPSDNARFASFLVQVLCGIFVAPILKLARLRQLISLGCGAHLLFCTKTLATSVSTRSIAWSRP